MCHPPTEVLYSVIFALFRRLYEVATSPTVELFPYTATGPPDVPTSGWTTWYRNPGILAIKTLLPRLYPSAGSVAMVWQAIAVTYLLEGIQDPYKPSESHSRDLDKHLTSMLQKSPYQDPCPQWKNAIPLGLVMTAAASYDPYFQISHFTSNLIHIALFFCLRSCEYTKNTIPQVHSLVPLPLPAVTWWGRCHSTQ